MESLLSSVRSNPRPKTNFFF
uniref:Uncharacterized protein n=1 Tax=Anguilla anguilla TaxID=7936 RepID=A0A0E9P8A0_ANGAN